MINRNITVKTMLADKNVLFYETASSGTVALAKMHKKIQKSRGL